MVDERDDDNSDDGSSPEVKSKPPSALVEQGEDSWPPWPWPPWGGDDDGDDDGGHKRPVNQTKRAQKLAKGVLKFESRIARASLDL